MTISFAPIQGVDWIEQLNQNFETLSTADLIELASEAETIAGTETGKGVTPAGLAALTANETRRGLVEIATTAEVIAGTDTVRAVTPAGVAAALGAYLIGGTITADADDETAGEVEINTGLTSATGFMVQIFRAGVNVTSDAVITLAAGVLTVADGAATYAVTAGDMINWIVF